MGPRVRQELFLNHKNSLTYTEHSFGYLVVYTL